MRMVAQLRVPGETIPISRHHIELVEYIHPRGEDIPLDTNRTVCCSLGLHGQ